MNIKNLFNQKIEFCKFRHGWCEWCNNRKCYKANEFGFNTEDVHRCPIIPRKKYKKPIQEDWIGGV